MPVIDVELLPRPISASISLSLISFCSATINFVLLPSHVRCLLRTLPTLGELAPGAVVLSGVSGATETCLTGVRAERDCGFSTRGCPLPLPALGSSILKRYTYAACMLKFVSLCILRVDKSSVTQSRSSHSRFPFC